MNLTFTTTNGTAIAVVTGNITHAVSGEFQSSLLATLAESRALVLDCSGIVMLTSAGLRVLLLLHREASAAGKTLVLASVPPAVCDVMEVTGFLDQFQLYPTVEAGAAAAGEIKP
jgi:anti-sigma B factor antagonist